MNLDSIHRKQAGVLANSIASRRGVEVRELLLATSAAAAKARGELCGQLIQEGWTPIQIDSHFGFSAGTCQRVAPPIADAPLATVHPIADAAEKRRRRTVAHGIHTMAPDRRKEVQRLGTLAALNAPGRHRLTGEKAREAGRLGGIRRAENARLKLTNVRRNHSSAAPACVKEEER